MVIMDSSNADKRKRDGSYNGWSVLVLPKECFVPEDGILLRFGLMQQETSSWDRGTKGKWLDVSASLLSVPDNATHPASNVYFASPRHQAHVFAPSLAAPAEPSPGTTGDEGGGFFSDSESDGEWAGDSPIIPEDSTPRYYSHARRALPDPATFIDDIRERFLGFHLAYIVIPTTGTIVEQPSDPAKLLHFHLAAPNRRKETRFVDLDVAIRTGRIPPRAAARFSVLRGYKRDLELVSLDPMDARVLCRRAIENCNKHSRPMLWDMTFGERIQTLLHVPGLDLVVAASMCGRVALLTPTCAIDRRSRPRRGFRVEWILPRDREERQKKRPFVCLAGVAVSPVPESTAYGLDLHGSSPARTIRRYRLILNYQDHTILMYTISRSSGDGSIDLIF